MLRRPCALIDRARAQDSSVVKTAPEILTTPRMRGERLGPEHQDVLLPIVADPRVGATMGGVSYGEHVLYRRLRATR